MNARLPRFARLRAAALGVLGVGLLASACEATLPTPAEVENMDVRSMEARTVALQGTGGTVTYYIDGKEVTAEEAHALAADRIAQMEVKRGDGTRSEVHIQTRARSEGGVTEVATSSEGGGSVVTTTNNAMGVTTTYSRGRVQIEPHEGFAGLVVIDGVITDPSALRNLQRDQIHQVDMIKGAEAARQYDDPRAANGVIRITTRRNR